MDVRRLDRRRPDAQQEGDAKGKVREPYDDRPIYLSGRGSLYNHLSNGLWTIGQQPSASQGWLSEATAAFDGTLLLNNVSRVLDVRQRTA